MEHLFIAPANVYSPRWLQAFGNARIITPGDTESSLSKNMLIWLLLDSESSAEVASNCLAQGAKVIAMTHDENPQQAKQVITAGASGYVHYLAVPSLLQQVAQVVSAGGVWLGADLMRQLMTLVALPGVAGMETTAIVQFDLLTPREQAVAEAVAAGKTNKEVARLLDITERTVKAHLGAVFEKLGVRDRLQLVLRVTGKA